MASGTSSSTSDSKTAGRAALLGELHKGILGPLSLGQLASGDDAGTLVAVRRLEVGGDVDDATLDALAAAVERVIALEHDNVVRIEEATREEKEIVIISAYQTAEPLRSVLRLAGIGRKPVPPAIATRMALDVLDAAAYLHANDVLAALTPDNVLLGSDGVTRVLEAGVSQAAASEPAWKEQPKRVTYAAPEQLGDAPGDGRSDLFSLGVLVWEMLRNRPLFGGSNFEQAAEKVRTGAIGRADALKPAGGEAIPKALADVVERALARAPEDRFSSAEEMLEALGACKAASHAEVSKYARELLADAFAAQERKVGGAKRAVEPAKVSPPQKAKSLPGKPKLPPRTRNATMQVNAEDLLSVAPDPSQAPPADEAEDIVPPARASADEAVADDGVGDSMSSTDEPSSDEAAAEGSRPTKSREPVDAEAEADPQGKAAASGKARGREPKKTLIGMVAPSQRPAASSPPQEDEDAAAPADSNDTDVDLEEAAPPAAAKAPSGGGFDVMSIADDPSDPDGMDAVAAEALERVRKSQAPASSPSPAAKFTPVVTVADEPPAASSGNGKWIAVAGVVVLVAVGGFFALKGGDGDAAPAATATGSPTTTVTATATAVATATPPPSETAAATPEPSAAASASAPPLPSASASAAATVASAATTAPAATAKPNGPSAAPPTGAPARAPGPVPAGPARPKYNPSDI